MQLSFGTIRFLLAISVIGLICRLVRPVSLGELILAIVGAIPSAVLVLVVRKRDRVAIIRTLLLSGAGAVIGLLFCPMIRPPYDFGDEYRYMIVGVLVGGLLVNSFFKSEAVINANIQLPHDCNSNSN